MEEMSIAIFKILDSIYPKEIKFIKKDDPFRFLVTVILSASSTDINAEKAEENLHQSLKSANEIASADLALIESLIKSAGLAKGKARGIKALAETIVNDGKIPETIEELTKIPSIGVKTANCYLEYIGKPAVIVDTHVARVSKRLALANSDDRDKVYASIRNLYDESLWTRISMTLNLHGRVCCKARKPLCSNCPLSSICPSRDSFS